MYRMRQTCAQAYLDDSTTQSGKDPYRALTATSIAIKKLEEDLAF